jgi:hypothetical protein
VPVPAQTQNDDQPLAPLAGSATGASLDRSALTEPIEPNAEPVADAAVEAEDNDTLPQFSDTVGDPSVVSTERASVLGSPGLEKETNPAQPGADIGQFISDQQVLVRYDSQNDDWRRLLPREPIAMDDRLLVLPTFRPQILLSSGITLTIEGPAAIEVKTHQDGSTIEISVGYGRIVMTTVGTAEAPIALRIGHRSGVLRFADSQTEVAVDVERLHDPGSDPSQTDSHQVMKIWVIRGRISWQEEGQVADSVGEGHVYFLVDQQAGWTGLTEELPDWIHARSVKDIDRLASSTIEPSLTSDRPVTLSLHELSEDRRAEVSSLAARCLSHFNEFEPLVATLNDDKQRSFWTTHFDSFQLALARDPATAEQVRGALERIRGQDASQLFRMLWGYSETDLRDGSDSELVDNLDHDSLDFRMLSIENLRRITGATLNYLPQHSAKRRRSSSVRWRDRQEKGLVKYEAAPVTVPRPIAGP